MLFILIVNIHYRVHKKELKNNRVALHFDEMKTCFLRFFRWTNLIVEKKVVKKISNLSQLNLLRARKNHYTFARD